MSSTNTGWNGSRHARIADRKHVRPINPDCAGSKWYKCSFKRSRSSHRSRVISPCEMERTVSRRHRRPGILGSDAKWRVRHTISWSLMLSPSSSIRNELRDERIREKNWIYANHCYN